MNKKKRILEKGEVPTKDTLGMKAAKKSKSKPTLEKVAEKSSSSDSSSDSSDGGYPMVCVDWHNTLAYSGKIPKENLDALLDLWGHNFDICVLSWCYKNRAKEVQSACAKLEGPWKRLTCKTTEVRTGKGGKADLCNDWGIKYIFDDAPDICSECHTLGLEVYPIKTKYEKHGWSLGKGVATYKSFAQAVKAFLEKHKKQ